MGKKKEPKTSEVEKTYTADILKVDEDQRMVYGWASVFSKDGEIVIDLQDDVLDAEDFVKSVTSFMMDLRTAKSMHEGEKIGDVIHSLPLTNEIAKALDIESDMEGWIVGVKVFDDDIWKSVKDGTLKAFSIGGVAERIDANAS